MNKYQNIEFGKEACINNNNKKKEYKDRFITTIFIIYYYYYYYFMEFLWNIVKKRENLELLLVCIDVSITIEIYTLFLIIYFQDDYNHFFFI